MPTTMRMRMLFIAVFFAPGTLASEDSCGCATYNSCADCYKNTNSPCSSEGSCAWGVSTSDGRGQCFPINAPDGHVYVDFSDGDAPHCEEMMGASTCTDCHQLSSSSNFAAWCSWVGGGTCTSSGGGNGDGKTNKDLCGSDNWIDFSVNPAGVCPSERSPPAASPPPRTFPPPSPPYPPQSPGGGYGPAPPFPNGPGSGASGGMGCHPPTCSGSSLSMNMGSPSQGFGRRLSENTKAGLTSVHWHTLHLAMSAVVDPRSGCPPANFQIYTTNVTAANRTVTVDIFDVTPRCRAIVQSQINENPAAFGASLSQAFNKHHRLQSTDDMTVSIASNAVDFVNLGGLYVSWQTISVVAICFAALFGIYSCAITCWAFRGRCPQLTGASKNHMSEAYASSSTTTKSHALVKIDSSDTAIQLKSEQTI